MSTVIGIDLGISSTKIVGIENGKRIKSPMAIKGSDSVSSMYGAFGKYVHDNDISLDDIEHITITGVGAQESRMSLYDIPTSCVDEFKANGLGARFDSGLDHIVVVSMGSGTSLVLVEGDDIKHIGGIGMGGGTLQGLSHLLLNTSDITRVAQWAEEGLTSHINLTIGEVCREKIDGLTDFATASLFAKASHSDVTRNDIAAGLIHMVLETIGSCAVLSQLESGIKDFVLIGNLTRLAACKQVFPMLEKLYDVRFHIPKFAFYCTALGAALSCGVPEIE